MTTKLAGYELGHVYLQAGCLKYKVTELFDENTVQKANEKYNTWYGSHAITVLYSDGRQFTGCGARWGDLELPKECFDSCQDGRTNCYNCEKRYWYLKTKEETTC